MPRGFKTLIIFTLVSFSFGQYYFGKNKIQPIKYDWRVLQSAHFDIYYYPEEDSIARFAAHVAESVYDCYARHFEFHPSDRIPIVIYSSPTLFAETHIVPFIIPEQIGGFTEYILERVVVPFDGDTKEFIHILAHELVHIWQLELNQFVHDAHERFFINMPELWFAEGQAEVLSQKEGIDERSEIIEALINEDLLLPADFHKIYGTFKMYKLAESFLRFLRERYGLRSDVLILEKMWTGAYIDDMFPFLFGVTIEDAGLLWRQWLLRRFGQYAGSLTPIKFAGKVLTRDGYFASAVRLDSATVIAKGNRLGYSGIYMVKKRKAKLIRKIELTESSEATRFFKNRIALKGSLLVFSAKSRGKEKLFIKNISNSKEKAFELKDIVQINSPSFTDDGSIIFSGTRISGFRDIFKLNSKTGKLVKITDDPYFDDDPVSTGDTTVFVSDRGKSQRKWLFMMDNDTIYRLCSNAPINNPFSPAISPSREKIAFIADDDTFPNIYIYNLSTDTLYMAHRLAARPVSISFAGEDTLLVCVCTKGECPIMSLPLDSLTSLGVYRKEPVVSSWYPPLTFAQPAESLASKPKSAHKLKLNFAQGEIGMLTTRQTAAGLELSLTDIVGDRNLYLFLANNAREWSEVLKETNVAAIYNSNLKHWRFGFGAYHLNLHTYDRYEGSYSERIIGVIGTANYSISRFTRLELGAMIYHSKRTTFKSSRDDIIFDCTASFIRDNSLWWTTGPIDGMRTNITIGSGVGASGKIYRYIVSLDFRRYLRLSKYSCLAGRVIARTSGGKEPLRFFLGGSLDLRGYQLFQFYGRNLILFNSELRFPVFERIFIATPIVDIDIPGINGALFFDAGDAWEEEPKVVGAIGGGLRLNLSGYLVLRLDVAYKTDFKTISKKPRFDLFFGWDY